MKGKLLGLAIALLILPSCTIKPKEVAIATPADQVTTGSAFIENLSKKGELDQVQKYVCRKLQNERDTSLALQTIVLVIGDKVESTQTARIEATQKLATNCLESSSSQPEPAVVPVSAAYNHARDFHRVRWNAEIIDPPTNCRETPNGKILHVFNDREFVKLSKPTADGKWYLEVNYNCLIHVSQFRGLEPVI